MTRQEQESAINALESRLLELAAAMRKSDEHALKCYKMGLDFGKEYADEYSAYLAARTEYNEVEGRIGELRAAEVEEPEAVEE
jgi:hypothetical protein